jgi:hypothetical protein
MLAGMQMEFKMWWDVLISSEKSKSVNWFWKKNTSRSKKNTCHF